MLDRLLVRGYSDSPFAGLVEILDGVRGLSRLMEMPGELEGYLIRLFSVKGFQYVSDLTMQERSFDLVQAVVEIPLKQDMLEEIEDRRLAFSCRIPLAVTTW
ncbi:hypothetical protein ACFLR7_07445 [Acidobacteriota bacterium]